VRALPAEASPARLVVFDFDGTLTRPDVFRLFVRQLHTRRRVVVSLLRHLHRLVPAVLRGGTARDRAKESLCITLLGGLPEAEARSAADQTARMVLRTCLRPDVVERLRRHIASGDRVIVVSASFDAYVRPVMAALGVHEVVATRWEVDPRTGSLTGRIAGTNVRGMAKVRLLQEHMADAPCVVDVAYGNSRGDAALLATATHPVWVRRYRGLAAPTW
jgi:phosphatidylglycerophosphatase C